MPVTERASSSILVAGVFAIVGGVLGMFFALTALILFSTVPVTGSVPLPAVMRPILYGTWVFLSVCGIFVAVTGIQVIRLRNWARISLLIIAGCLLFFGAMGIVVIVVAVFSSAPLDPRISQQLLLFILTIIYGVPIAISLWWLILFTRPSVVTQFRASAPLESPLPRTSFSVLNNPECPLAVRIVGWYLASFVLFLPLLPFLPIRLPAYFFGHLFRGQAANGIYFLNFVLLIITGSGLLMLKRWSYPLAYASQLLVCANGLSSAFSPSYEKIMQSVFSDMNLPSMASGMDQMMRFGRYASLFGLVIPVAILVTLFLSHHKFYEAAERASSRGSLAPTPNSPL